MKQPTLFRTWDDEGSHRNVTIVEAIRATSVKRTLFPEIAGKETIETPFLDAGYGWNNPVRYVLQEAKTLAPTPSCIVSLGTGLESIIELPNYEDFQRPYHLIQVFKTTARDCGETAEGAARDFSGKPDFYFRLNVDREMQDISLEEWEQWSDVEAHTKRYLLRHEVREKVARLMNVLHPPVI